MLYGLAYQSGTGTSAEALFPSSCPPAVFTPFHFCTRFLLRGEGFKV